MRHAKAVYMYIYFTPVMTNFRLIIEQDTQTQSIENVKEVIKNLETEVEKKRTGNVCFFATLRLFKAGYQNLISVIFTSVFTYGLSN